MGRKIRGISGGKLFEWRIYIVELIARILAWDWIWIILRERVSIPGRIRPTEERGLAMGMGTTKNELNSTQTPGT